MPIETLTKGALPDVSNVRDYRIPLMGIAPVNWNGEFRLPTPLDSDQAQADCCVGEAWSYYHWQIKGPQFSVRSVFAYIAQLYGAYIRDGGLQIKKFGQETQMEAPDPNPKTPQNMRDKTGLDPLLAIGDMELDSWVLPDNSIDGVAWGIQSYKGVVFGVNGTNEGWADMENPRPPSSGEAQWGHALYAMGYHLHNGVKCIICKSSWCNEVKEHHIKENYFVSGNTFNAWTLIPKGLTRMLVFFKVKGLPTIWALMDGEWVGFADQNAFGKYLDGRPNVVMEIDQVEFNKVKSNPDIFKS